MARLWEASIGECFDSRDALVRGQLHCVAHEAASVDHDKVSGSPGGARVQPVARYARIVVHNCKIGPRYSVE